jgi:hypothetical protein
VYSGYSGLAPIEPVCRGIPHLHEAVRPEMLCEQEKTLGRVDDAQAPRRAVLKPCSLFGPSSLDKFSAKEGLRTGMGTMSHCTATYGALSLPERDWRKRDTRAELNGSPANQQRQAGTVPSDSELWTVTTSRRMPRDGPCVQLA